VRENIFIGQMTSIGEDQFTVLVQGIDDCFGQILNNQ